MNDNGASPLVRWPSRLEFFRNSLGLDVKVFSLRLDSVIKIYEGLLGLIIGRECAHLCESESLHQVLGVHGYLYMDTLRLFVDSQGTLTITAPEGKGRSLSRTLTRSFAGPDECEPYSHKDLCTFG